MKGQKEVQEVNLNSTALIGHTDMVRSVILSANNETLVSGGMDKTLRVWSLKTSECARVLKGHTDFVCSVALGTDNETLVSGSWDKTVRVWSLKTGQCQQILRDHTEQVDSVALTKDNQTLISGSQDKTLRVWSLKNGQCQQTLKGHTDAVLKIALGLDNETLVSGGADNTLRVWSLTTGKCLQVFEGHTSWITSIGLGSDNETLVSGSRDNTLRVWSLKTGKCLHKLKGHTYNVSNIVLSPNNELMFSAGADETLRIWSLKSGDCLKEIEFENVFSIKPIISKNNLYVIISRPNGDLRFEHVMPLAKIEAEHHTIPKPETAAIAPTATAAAFAEFPAATIVNALKPQTHSDIQQLKLEASTPMKKLYHPAIESRIFEAVLKDLNAVTLTENLVDFSEYVKKYPELLHSTRQSVKSKRYMVVPLDYNSDQESLSAKEKTGKLPEYWLETRKKNIHELDRLLLELDKLKTSSDGKYLPEPELALRRAAAIGDLNVIRLLISSVNDLDINKTGPTSGKTALDFAESYGKSEAVKLLLANGGKSGIKTVSAKNK